MINDIFGRSLLISIGGLNQALSYGHKTLGPSFVLIPLNCPIRTLYILDILFRLVVFPIEVKKIAIGSIMPTR